MKMHKNLIFLAALAAVALVQTQPVNAMFGAYDEDELEELLERQPKASAAPAAPREGWGAWARRHASNAASGVRSATSRAYNATANRLWRRGAPVAQQSQEGRDMAIEAEQIAEQADQVKAVMEDVRVKAVNNMANIAANETEAFLQKLASLPGGADLAARIRAALSRHNSELAPLLEKATELLAQPDAAA